MRDIQRRDFLKSTATLAASTACCSLVGTAKAATIAPPTVDTLTVTVLVDSSFDLFAGAEQVKGLKIERARSGKLGTSLHNQFGLSLYVESTRGSDRQHLLLDFGYSPDALINNMSFLGIDPAKIGTMVLSHGHFDHYGGLLGFLDKYRGAMPPEVTLYAGGEDNFCHRLVRTGTSDLADFGTIDRRALAKQRVNTILAQTPTVINNHAFTTGAISRTSFEKTPPTSNLVEFKVENGLGCDASHFGHAELQGQIVLDQQWNEHATCFNVKDRGLVVITSCGHAGIVNSIRQAQTVSGVRKLHALVGGTHLGPAPKPLVDKEIAAVKEEFHPDFVIPMHCSGLSTVLAVRDQMPDALVTSYTGSRYTFGV